MKILDKILYRQLEKIRGELNSYIAERIEENLCETSMPIVEPIIQHNSIGGSIGNFLDVMRLEEDDLDYANEEYYDDEAPGGRNTPYSNQRGVGVDCWNQKKSNQWYANRRADQEMNRDLTKYGAKPYNR